MAQPFYNDDSIIKHGLSNLEYNEDYINLCNLLYKDLEKLSDYVVHSWVSYLNPIILLTKD